MGTYFYLPAFEFIFVCFWMTCFTTTAYLLIFYFRLKAPSFQSAIKNRKGFPLMLIFILHVGSNWCSLPQTYYEKSFELVVYLEKYHVRSHTAHQFHFQVFIFRDERFSIPSFKIESLSIITYRVHPSSFDRRRFDRLPSEPRLPSRVITPASIHNVFESWGIITLFRVRIIPYFFMHPEILSHPSRLHLQSCRSSKNLIISSSNCTECSSLSTRRSLKCIWSKSFPSELWDL